MWIVTCTLGCSRVLRLRVSYACVVHIERIISPTSPINQIIILNGTLPSATLNGKWKFVGHVEQFRSAFCHCPCTISFVQTASPHLPLSFSLFLCLASWHTCLLAPEMALWRPYSGASRQQLWFMPQWKPSLYGLYRTMNVSSKLCQLQSITVKTIWQ